MVKQFEHKPKSFGPVVNTLATLLAFVIIGYVVWVSINVKPRVIKVASAPTFTTIDLNEPMKESEIALEPPVADASDTDDEDPSTGDSVSEEPIAELPAKPKVLLGPAPDFYNVDVAKFLFEDKCSECHRLKRVEKYPFADVTAVERVIDKMVENGLQVNGKERSFLDYYVQSTFVD